MLTLKTTVCAGADRTARELLTAAGGQQRRRCKMARRIKHADPSFSGDHGGRDSASKVRTPSTQPASCDLTRTHTHGPRGSVKSSGRRTKRAAAAAFHLFQGALLFSELKVVVDTHGRDDEQDRQKGRRGSGTHTTPLFAAKSTRTTGTTPRATLLESSRSARFMHGEAAHYLVRNQTRV